MFDKFGKLVDNVDSFFGFSDDVFEVEYPDVGEVDLVGNEFDVSFGKFSNFIEGHFLVDGATGAHDVQAVIATVLKAGEFGDDGFF